MANNNSLVSLGIQLPYNMQAEQSVLGAALMDETILNRLITEMDPDMFYSEQNRAVYEEMRRLFSESEAVDVITLVDSLPRRTACSGRGRCQGVHYPHCRNCSGSFQCRFLYQSGKIPDPPPDRSGPRYPAAVSDPVPTCCWKAPTKNCMISATARTAPVSKRFRSPSPKLLIPCKSCPARTAIELPVSHGLQLSG